MKKQEANKKRNKNLVQTRCKKEMMLEAMAILKKAGIDMKQSEYARFSIDSWSYSIVSKKVKTDTVTDTIELLDKLTIHKRSKKSLV